MIRPARFEPQKAGGTVRIAAPAIISYMLVPGLMRGLARESPGFNLEIVSWSGRWRGELERGAVDLTVDVTGDERNLATRPLVTHEWACVLRKGHPALNKKWSLELFAGLDHVPTLSFAKGTTLQFSATGGYSDSTTQDLTTQVTGFSSNQTTAEPLALIAMLSSLSALLRDD